MELKLDLILGDKKMNDWMHMLDAFEETKVLGEFTQIVIEGEFDLWTITKKLADYLEEDYAVHFIGIKTIDNYDAKNAVHYLKPNISSISDGRKWGTFRDLLCRLGYDVYTNDRMIVTNVLN